MEEDELWAPAASGGGSLSPVLLGEKAVTAHKEQPLVLAPLWKADKIPGTQEEIISLQISQEKKKKCPEGEV